MSILATATQPTPTESAIALVVGLIVTTGAVVIAYGFGLFRPRSLVLPDRYPPHKSGWWLALVSFVGLITWFGGQSAYVVYVIVKNGGGVGGEGGFDPEKLTPQDYAFLATVPAAVGIVALLVGDGFLGGAVVRSGLGYDAKKLPKGLAYGALAMVFTFPIVVALGFALEFVYQKIGFEHPKEHELLKALGDSTAPAIRWALIAGASLGAPLFEELFFRGHLQTAIRRWGLWLAGSTADVLIPAVPAALPSPMPPEPFGDPLEPTASSPVAPELNPLVTPANEAVIPPPAGFLSQTLPYLTPLPWKMPAWPSWMAIVITSAFFAIVHPLWSAPLIFALSICLGYAYERTNNLWVTITMHAIFNGLQTFLFLKGFSGE